MTPAAHPIPHCAVAALARARLRCCWLRAAAVRRRRGRRRPVDPRFDPALHALLPAGVLDGGRAPDRHRRVVRTDVVLRRRRPHHRRHGARPGRRARHRCSASRCDSSTPTSPTILPDVAAGDARPRHVGHDRHPRARAEPSTSSTTSAPAPRSWCSAATRPGITDIKDLCGKVVAVEKGTTQVDLLARAQANCAGSRSTCRPSPRTPTRWSSCAPVGRSPCSTTCPRPRPGHRPAHHGALPARLHHAVRAGALRHRRRPRPAPACATPCRARSRSSCASGIYAEVLQRWSVESGAVDADQRQLRPLTPHDDLRRMVDRGTRASTNARVVPRSDSGPEADRRLNWRPRHSTSPAWSRRPSLGESLAATQERAHLRLVGDLDEHVRVWRRSPTWTRGSVSSSRGSPASSRCSRSLAYEVVSALRGLTLGGHLGPTGPRMRSSTSTACRSPDGRAPPLGAGELSLFATT